MSNAPEDCNNADCCWDTSGDIPKKIEGDPTGLVLLIIIPMFVGIILCIVLAKVFGHLGDRGLQYYRAKQLFSQSVVVITWFGTTSWGVQKFVNPCTNASQWFNGELGVTAQTVIIGMMANVVFGFIDNAGLFFGGCYLDEVFALLPGSEDANVAAGYGNTYSDLLGAFMGTFCGLILQDATGVSDGPLWANAVGIVVGCLLGIAIPKLIVGNSSTKGLNKISAKQVLLGAMENEELEAIVEGSKTLFDFRVEQTFKKLDSDGSGYLDVDEIRNYMVDAMGDDFNEEQFQEDLKEVFQIHKDSNDQEVDMQEFRDIYKNMAQETLKNRKKEMQEKTDKVVPDNMGNNIDLEGTGSAKKNPALIQQKTPEKEKSTIDQEQKQDTQQQQSQEPQISKSKENSQKELVENPDQIEQINQDGVNNQVN